MDFIRRHLFEIVGAPFDIWLRFALARRLIPFSPAADRLKAAGLAWAICSAGAWGFDFSWRMAAMNANIVRFHTPYVYGHYKKDGRQIYVSRGLGTVGIPSRVGAPPEVSLLTLCAT